MPPRKLYKELSQKRQRMLINQKVKDQVEDELMLLDEIASADKTSTREEDEELEISSAQDKTVDNQGCMMNIYDIPIFGRNNSEKKNSELAKANSLENYLSKIRYQKFCKNFAITDDIKTEELFEAQEYLWSDSDTDSEEEDGFEEELRVIGRGMKRDDLTCLLRLLRKMGHKNLPNSAENLLDTPVITKISKCEDGEYFHYGVLRCLEDAVTRGCTLPRIIELDFGFDGLPVTKSGKRKLWPITGRVFNNPSISPFLAGCYHGTKEPTSAVSYLTPFVNDFKEIQNRAINIKGSEHRIVLRNIICDTPARCLVSGAQLYNGYWGCGKCETKGDWCDKVVFLEYDAPLRTNESFRQRRQPEHHKEDSPLEELDIDMVKNFPLDYMHLVCLGVVKLLLKLWFRSNKALFSAVATAALSKILEGLAKYVPKEFSRKTQSLSDFGRWKATQLRFFLLYAGPIVLQDQLPEKVLRHFNLLSCAIRILCHPEDYKRNNKTAENLLLHFVKQMQDENFYYGQEHITFNVHNLIHIAQECINNNGPLDTFSAFEFENYMQFLKKLLRKQEKPLQQLHRRISEGHHPEKKVKPVNKYELRDEIKTGTPPYACDRVYRKLIFEDFVLSTKSPDNGCIVIKNSRVFIVMIEAIGMKNGKKRIFGKTFQSTASLKDYPITDSREVGIFELGQLSPKVESYEVDHISNKMVYFLHESVGYAVLMLHHSS